MGLHTHKARQAPSEPTSVYVRHRSEATLLYQIIQEYWPEFQAELANHGKHLPAYVTKEFDEYLKCGRLEHGFLRVQCETCHDEKLVAFSCKRRGFSPSCGARKMADSAALLVDEILPHQPMRQWVISVPFPLGFCSPAIPKSCPGCWVSSTASSPRTWRIKRALQNPLRKLVPLPHPITLAMQSSQFIQDRIRMGC